MSQNGPAKNLASRSKLNEATHLTRHIAEQISPKKHSALTRRFCAAHCVFGRCQGLCLWPLSFCRCRLAAFSWPLSLAAFFGRFVSLAGFISSGVIGGVQFIGDESTGGVILEAGGELHLIGNQFSLSGMPIEGLAKAGNSVLVTLPDSASNGPQLRGMLTDGQAFRFDLQPFLFRGSNFDLNATLRLTLVPEPASSCMAVFAALSLIVRRRLRQNDQSVKSRSRSSSNSAAVRSIADSKATSRP